VKRLVPARVLGALGVLGGAVLLAGFVGFPAELNPLRLVLWYLGGIAVAVAAFEPQPAISRRLALSATIPLGLASACAILWILLGIGRESPFSGTFGLVGFWAGLAGWLAAALFGFVAARLGVLWRWASLALAIGSLVAITGMDRLALTSRDNPTLFAPIALAGIAVAGTAWLLLGAQIAVGGARPRPTVVDDLHRRAQA